MFHKYFYNSSYAQEFCIYSLGQAVLKEAAKRNMGCIALKVLANHAKLPEEKPSENNSGDGFVKCWYRPIFDDPVLADMALLFTLSQDVHSAVSPGDVRMLRLGLSIMEKYNGNPPPPDAGELEELKRRAALTEKTIF